MTTIELIRELQRLAEKRGTDDAVKLVDPESNHPPFDIDFITTDEGEILLVGVKLFSLLGDK